MKLILPTRVTLDLTRDGANATMRYVESFDGALHPLTGLVIGGDELLEIVRNTVAMCAPMMGGGLDVAVSDDGRAVVISGTGSYNLLASVLTTEFLNWTSMMEMTLAELLVTSATARR